MRWRYRLVSEESMIDGTERKRNGKCVSADGHEYNGYTMMDVLGSFVSPGETTCGALPHDTIRNRSTRMDFSRFSERSLYTT